MDGWPKRGIRALTVVALLCWPTTWLLAQSHASLTLADALARARAASPRLQAARISVDGARKAASAFSRLDNPSLEMRWENWGPASANAGVLTDTFVVASQPLPLGGRRRAARDVLTAEAASAAAQVGPTQLALELEVVRRFVDAVAAREELALLDAQANSVAELAQVVGRRVAAGATAGADGARLAAELGRVHRMQLQARVELGRHLSTLGLLVDETARLDADRLVVPAFAPPPLDARGELVDALVAKDPAVVAARARLEVARGTRLFEEAAARLQATAVGGYKRTAGISTGVAAVALSLPVWDRNATGRARASAAEQVAGLAVADAERGARTTALVLLETLDALGRSLRDIDTTVGLDVVRAAARARLREGAGDVLGVVDAERLWHDAQRDGRLLMRDALHASLELRLRLGLEIQP